MIVLTTKGPVGRAWSCEGANYGEASSLVSHALQHRDGGASSSNDEKQEEEKEEKEEESGAGLEPAPGKPLSGVQLCSVYLICRGKLMNTFVGQPADLNRYNLR